MPRNERHIVPNPTGGWDIRKPGADHSSGHFDRQSDAIDRAKEILGRDGGGEAVIHGTDNLIRNRDTVAPGNDPFPPRDKR
jgi:Uncharacterized protein conserved in bacteria (DUF2188)